MPERPITDAVLDEHDALREKATPGPWVVVGEFDRQGPVHGGLGIEHHGPEGPNDPSSCAISYGFGPYMPPVPADATYITTLANDDAAMCAELRRLRAALEFYADQRVYEEPERESRDIDGKPMRTYGDPPVWDDYGKRARAALAQPDEAEGRAHG